MSTPKGMIDLNNMKSVFRPWYIFLGVSISLLAYGLVAAGAGELSSIQSAIGFGAAILLAFVAHGYRTQYLIEKENTERITRLLTEIADKEEELGGPL